MDHSHFILTVDVPLHVSPPSRYIAQMLREAAMMVEKQVVLDDHHGIYDLYGAWKYGWETAPGEPARRRSLRVVKVVKRN